MSSAAQCLPPASLLVALALAACANAPAAPPAETAAAPAVETPDIQFASPEARAVAERAPPLERANFWAREHAKDPTHLETALIFADALRGIGSDDRAEEVARQMTVLHPMSADAYLMLGRSLAAQDKHAEARRMLSVAVTLAPDSAAALAALGLAHDRLGDHVSAQTAYAQALEIEPDRAGTLSNYGLSLALTGDLDEAEARLRAAAALPGATSRIRQNLALVLGLQGRFEEMREVAADAPEGVLERNIEALKALRGDDVAGTGEPGGGEAPLRGALAEG